MKSSNATHDASMYDDSASGGVDASSADISHLAPLQRRIYAAISAEAPDYPEGVDVQQIVARCKNVDLNEIQCVYLTYAGMQLTTSQMTGISIKPVMNLITLRLQGRYPKNQLVSIVQRPRPRCD